MIIFIALNLNDDDDVDDDCAMANDDTEGRYVFAYIKQHIYIHAFQLIETHQTHTRYTPHEKCIC